VRPNALKMPDVAIVDALMQTVDAARVLGLPVRLLFRVAGWREAVRVARVAYMTITANQGVGSDHISIDARAHGRWVILEAWPNPK